jgi:hypothetical protein
MSDLTPRTVKFLLALASPSSARPASTFALVDINN